MKQEVVTGRDFAKTDFSAAGLPAAEFESCLFTECGFVSADLSGTVFIDCRFVRCDLSLADVRGTVFSGVEFSGCKMLGFRWERCNGTGLDVSFGSCMLDHSSFAGVRMAKTLFTECRLREADMQEADFRETLFDRCDFDRAVFGGTNLAKADLRTSFNFAIAPDENNVAKARFSREGLPGLLGKYGIVIEE